MFKSNNELMLFNSIIVLKKPILNEELKLLKFFYENTKIFPLNILINNNFVFIFVNNENFFAAKHEFRKLRNKVKLPSKKYLIMRAESTFIRLIFTFFQDTYIHNIHFEKELNSEVKIVRIFFLFKKDRLIAVGNNGDYIKTVNFIFNHYLYITNYNRLKRVRSIEISCEIIR